MAAEQQELAGYRFISFDETPVFYRVVSPAGPPKAVIFILHGMGEHGGRYVPVAEYLAEMGFECWLPDLRGFGQSGGRRGHVSRFSDFEKDVEALYSLAERHRRGVPFFLLAHSFGGLVGSRLAAGRKLARLKGIILTSPLFGVAVPVPPPLHFLVETASLLMPRYTQNNRVKAELLTHDPFLLAAHEADSRIHSQITARLYTEMLRAIAESRFSASQIQIPALILQAGDDRIVSREKTVRFYERLASTDKEMAVYDGWYHEILNETGRQEVFARIGQWIFKHI